MSQVHLDSKQIQKGLIILALFVLLRAVQTYAAGANYGSQTTWQHIIFLSVGFLILHAVMEEELRVFHARTLANAREQLGEPAFQSAWEAGSAWSLEEAVRKALEE